MNHRFARPTAQHPARARALVALAASVALCIPRLALAQMEAFPHDLYQQRLSLRGGTLAACVYAESMVGDFNAAVARAVGEALLLNVDIQSLDLLTPPEPLDYRIPLREEELFLMLHGRCDVFMGFPMTTGYPDWLRLTVPYFASPTVLVVADPSYTSLSDIPVSRPLGSRILASSDAHLTAYIAQLPAASRWQRFPYRNYGVAFERVVDGTVGGSLIWEAAVVNATEGDLAAQGLHLIRQLPFFDEPVELTIGLKAEDDFLGQALSQAIESLRADGTLRELAETHYLSPIE